MPNLIKLLFSPSGRIGRVEYLIGLVGLVLIYTLHGLLVRALGESIAGLFALLSFIFVILQVIYSVYGKRLHDIGRTLWPLTGLFSLIIALILIVMLLYGGEEYLTAHMEASQAGITSPEVLERINAEFKKRQAPALPVLIYLITTLLGGFTLWLALAKPDPETNQYGPPPQN